MNCETCTTPTKYDSQLWNMATGENVKMFDCRNLECELKMNRIMAAEVGRIKSRIHRINMDNKINIEIIKVKRIRKGITLRTMADKLGISPSQYSNYEQYREALPVEMVDRINEVFRGEMK